MSVTGINSGDFQSAMAEMRQKLGEGRAKAISKIGEVVAANQGRFEEAASAAAAKAQREIDDALAEFAVSGDNGGPA
jgi:hypothetical protein